MNRGSAGQYQVSFLGIQELILVIKTIYYLVYYFNINFQQISVIYFPSTETKINAVLGAIAASTTTPLDVAKTRIMLAGKHDSEASQSFIRVMREIQAQEGTKALYAGVKLRTFWITIGGFIYLGSLEKFKNILDKK